jgi:hypothetical protein
MMGEKERRDLFSNKCRKITMIHHKCGFQPQPQPKILANRLIAIFTIPADSLRSTVSLQLIHQMDLSSQWVHQSQLDVGFKASKHFNCMLKASVLAVYKKSYQDQLEFVTMGSIYQIQFAHPDQLFHEIYMVALMYRSSLTNLLVVQCLQLPTFLEPEAL